MIFKIKPMMYQSKVFLIKFVYFFYYFGSPYFCISKAKFRKKVLKTIVFHKTYGIVSFDIETTLVKKSDNTYLLSLDVTALWKVLEVFMV